MDSQTVRWTQRGLRYEAGYSGSGRAWGIDISTRTVTIDTLPVPIVQIRPVNSNGAAASCVIPLPTSEVLALVEALLSAIAETAPKSEIKLTSVESLIAEHGTWADHPIYSRKDWGIETGLRNTQRGYWDWVAASIEQNEGESDALLPSTDSLGQPQQS